MIISEPLQKAQSFEKEALEKQTFAPKQEFHVCAPVGWINDPNGFSEYKQEKHLFFQYHPYETIWGPMHWGHMKTKDFIQWELLPIALAPDMPYDSEGCFSGSAFEWEGKHVLLYTGVHNGFQTQCVAVGDGMQYEKLPGNPIIDRNLIPEGGSPVDFRDPKVWKDGKDIYLVVGNRSSDNSGQILLYHSLDLEHWDYVGILAQSHNRYGKMWECPDFFELDGEHVLIVSPQEMLAEEYRFHVGDGTIYFSGSYEKEHHTFTEKEVRTLDHGLDFYAPQTMVTGDNRRILIAWMQSWSGNLFGKEDGFCGMMTIPRELQVKNGVLYQLPVKELEQYRKNKVEVLGYETKQEYEELSELRGRIMDMEITVFPGEYSEFELRVAANEEFFTSISYQKADQTVVFSREKSYIRKDIQHVRKIGVTGDHSAFQMRIIMDRYSIEIFLNHGEQAITSVIKTPMEMDGVYIRADQKTLINICKYDICIE